VLRLHFTAEDLARTCLSTQPAPLPEAAFSLELLLRRHGGAAFEPWRDLARTRVRSPLPMLRHLIGPHGLWPGFLTTSRQSETAAAWDAFRATPHHLVHRCVRAVQFERDLPPWARTLAEGDPESLDHLTAEFRTYHAAAIAPVWPAVLERTRADHAARATLMARHGVRHLLGGLHPRLRWGRPQVLHCDLPDGPYGDVYLRGKGLRLTPSVFARTPDYWGGDFWAGGDPVPMITYPVAVAPLWHRTPTTAGHLTDLIGATRARVLAHVAAHHGLSTSELAHQLDLSLPTVSKHTTVLRASALITSHRHGHRVIHTATRLVSCARNSFKI
jgi:DNA-binding transcriptional ArsR family regulator